MMMILSLIAIMVIWSSWMHYHLTVNAVVFVVADALATVVAVVLVVVM